MDVLISSSLPNFAQGISQQPPTLRLNAQGEAQENGLSTVSKGLRKRPPTKHLKKILEAPLTGAYLHTINRDITEQYVVLITNGDLKVFDLDGVEKSVSFPQGKAYLTTSTPALSFSATSVADYTFIVNKTIKVQKDTLLTPVRPYEAIVNVKSGNYGKTYKILINGSSVASFTTPDGSTAAMTAQIATDYIATQLMSSYGAGSTSQAVTGITWLSYDQSEFVTTTVSTGSSVGGVSSTTSLVTKTYYYGATLSLPAGSTTTNSAILVGATTQAFTTISGVQQKVFFTPTTTAPTITSLRYTTGVLMRRQGNSIYITSGTDFSISTEDGFNNFSMVSSKGTTQYFTDLPSEGNFIGCVIKIIGDPSNQDSDYYAEYIESNNNSKGVWKESLASGISSGFYGRTMPWTLVRTSDGNFSFFSPKWDSRSVGDTKYARDPSFVGRTISEIFFYRDRLGFLSDESISFSESGQFFNFYPTSILSLLDADRIDVTTAHTKVANLKHAVPYNKSLLIFSEQTQFVIEDTNALTPKTITVKVATEFPCSAARPVGVGKNIYFVADKDQWSQFREYFPDTNTLNYDSTDVTGHLPKYIPAGITKITAATNEDMLVALSSQEPNSLYVYKYYWSNSEKLQNSWSKFTFGSDSTILSVDFIQSKLLIIVSRPDGVYLESMNVALGAIDSDEPYYVHLDRKRQLTTSAFSYNSVTGYSTIDLAAIGYLPQYGDYQVILKTGTGVKAGTILDVIWDGSTAKVKGDLHTCTGTFGRSYTFVYQLSPIVMKVTSATTSSQKSDSEGRLQIRKVSFNYAETGYFEVDVTPIGRDTSTYVYSGKVLGLTSGTIGSNTISTGAFKVPVLSRNTTTAIVVRNNSPLPNALLSADWEGMYVKRSTQV
jgi:hypothetical protein